MYCCKFFSYLNSYDVICALCNVCIVQDCYVYVYACVIQKQYQYMYELAAYHLSASSQQNENVDDGHLYANMSQL